VNKGGGGEASTQGFHLCTPFRNQKGLLYKFKITERIGKFAEDLGHSLGWHCSADFPRLWAAHLENFVATVQKQYRSTTVTERQPKLRAIGVVASLELYLS
jgi:hypothetical protein